jgi:hypothetical protein
MDIRTRLRCGQRQGSQLVGFCIVLLDALALVVHNAVVTLRFGIALLRRESEICERHRVIVRLVSRHARAVRIGLSSKGC